MINFNQSKLDIPISIALGVATKSNKYDDNEKIIEKADNHMYTDKINQGQKNKNKMIAAMLKKLKNKSYEKFTHIKQVKKIAHLIGEKINLNKKRLALLDRAAYLHDIGMLAINDKILNKNAELSIKEWKKIKTHPEIGCRITDITERYSNISDIILNHHENWDGSGYPNGIKKENIPLCARIIRIADAFDVMLHNQVYKEKITKQEAIEELKSKSGIEFDPKLVSIFINQVLPNLDITP